jgi:hypothetical protein
MFSFGLTMRWMELLKPCSRGKKNHRFQENGIGLPRYILVLHEYPVKHVREIITLKYNLI